MADTEDEILELILPSRAEISETAPVLGSAYAILFTGEDTLSITSTNCIFPVTIAIQGRLYDRKRGIIPFAFDHVPFSDRTVKRDAFPLGPCYLMNVTVFVRSGNSRIGDTFVQVQVLRGSGAAAYRLATLLQGYITRYQDLAYPGSPIQSSIEGGGVTKTFIGTSGSMGAEISETVPAGARWQLLTFYTWMLASAAPVERRVSLHYRASGYAVMASPHPRKVMAGETRHFNWAVSMVHDTDMGLVYQSVGLPPAPLLLAGNVITTYTEGLQGGDQFGYALLTVQEWLEVA